VLAPSTIQEAADLVMEAFDLADKYTNPVLVLADGLIGQMMEPVAFREHAPAAQEKSWACTGCAGRSPNIVNSLYLDPNELEDHNHRIFEKYARMERDEVRVEHHLMDDADFCLAAYGTTARICKTAISALRAQGYKVGLIRPITLYPFPFASFRALPDTTRCILDVEMSMGQMVDDVRLAIGPRLPVRFYGRVGGVVPTPDEIVDEVKRLYEEFDHA
jgi:2-oxoglutarate ferredoxin oxidoreductase subunit alpha